MSLLKKLPASLLFAGVLTLSTAALPVTAQETAHQGSQKEEEKPGMEIWKWANFLILAGVLGYLIQKHMAPMLITRSEEIREGLAAGERAKAEADARAAAVSARLSGLDQAIAAMRADAQTERDREGLRLKRDTASELTRIQQNSAFEIESSTKLAKISVQRFAAKLAIELAEQKVRARMSPDMQAALLKNFLSELGSSSAAGKLS